jgi:hypothetical protein
MDSASRASVLGKKKVGSKNGMQSYIRQNRSFNQSRGGNGHGPRIDSFSRIGNHSCDGRPPMITPTLLRARSLDEPGAGIPHAGISEGAVGKPAVLP